MQNDEKNINKDTSNNDCSLNNLNEGSKLSLTSFYGDYSFDHFKTIIKEKVNFYKKDNSHLKEKVFMLENDISLSNQNV